MADSECDSHTTLPLSLIRRLHKAEIHCHLDGSIRIPTLISLAEEQGVTLPRDEDGRVDEERVRKSVQVREECEGMSEYLHAFDLALSVLQEPYAITRVMFEICEDAKSDGVQYIEIRFSPILHTNKGLNFS